MTFVLGPRAAAAGYRLFCFDEIGSTSGEAMARARAGDPGQLWVTTLRQTAGYGRRGRVWQMPAGNLAASCVIVLQGPRATLATLGFVAGLALHDALSTLSAPDIFKLKWPNDVLAGGAKVAGILLEAQSLADGRLAVVTGIGVNVAASPEGTPYPATTVRAAMGDAVSAERVFAALTDAWLDRVMAWEAGGFAAIRTAWLSAAAGLGGPIAVRSEGSVMRGVFETIDSDGQCMVRRDDGSLATVAAGDVLFGAAASERASGERASS